MSSPLARDTIFAAIALLRCRDRLEALLDAVGEPRCSELARVVALMEDFDEGQLKQTLIRAVRSEDERLREHTVRVLGGAINRAPRVVREWITQGRNP